MKASGKIRLGSMIAGIITAAIITLTQLFYFEVKTSTEQKPETEQQSSTTPVGQEQHLSLPAPHSLPVSAHVVLSHEFSFIEEIIFGESNPEFRPVEMQRATGKLFKALFQFIISPNAP